MLIFEDVWVVATIQTAKYGRFDKASLAQYNPGWVDFVWCMHCTFNAHALPRTTTFLACASLEYGPWLSHGTWVCSRRKHQSIKQHSESEVPMKSFLCMITYYHFIRIYHQQASEWYCTVSLARADRTRHILNEVGRMATLGLMNSSWLLLN